LIATKIHGPSIVLEQVAVREGQQILLDPITCTFEAEYWHAILGPNGSGKSSLLKTLLGLKNHSGTISLHKAGRATQKEQQTDIGYVPQLVPFDVSLPISVRDYLLMSLTRRPVFFGRTLNSEVKKALEQVRLQDKLERRLGDLSGGERQRLMLVCALLQQPSLLILDEPMSGLDASGRDDTTALLTRFRDAGGTILMVEHDWGLVQTHCDVVHWLDLDIKASGPCDRFFEVLEPVAGFNMQSGNQPSRQAAP
jgi:zinc transport system ATP-binding protein